MIFETTIRENIGLGDLSVEKKTSKKASAMGLLSWLNPFAPHGDTDLDFRLSKKRRAASKFSGAAEFIEKDLPKRYDTLISPKFKGGVSLSGGQMQKLAIARAATRILKDPPCGLFILDEPVGAIDAIAEAEFYDQLLGILKGNALKCKPTVILVTHRLQPLKQFADRIIVFGEDESGEMTTIVENGTHDQLMKNKKLYQKMVSAQEFQATD
jgi:ABC-type multidrug transport system fused ATPase/permease subunit